MDSIRMHWGHFRECVRGANVQLAHTQQNSPWMHERLLSSFNLKLTLQLSHSYSINHCGSASHYFLLMFLLISQIKSTWLKRVLLRHLHSRNGRSGKICPFWLLHNSMERCGKQIQLMVIRGFSALITPMGHIVGQFIGKLFVYILYYIYVFRHGNH